MNAPQCPENCRGDMSRAHRISLRHRNVDSRDSLIVVLRVAGVPRSERVNVEAHARQVTLVRGRGVHAAERLQRVGDTPARLACELGGQHLAGQPRLE